MIALAPYLCIVYNMIVFWRIVFAYIAVHIYRNWKGERDYGISI